MQIIARTFFKHLHPAPRLVRREHASHATIITKFMHNLCRVVEACVVHGTFLAHPVTRTLCLALQCGAFAFYTRIFFSDLISCIKLVDKREDLDQTEDQIPQQTFEMSGELHFYKQGFQMPWSIYCFM